MPVDSLYFCSKKQTLLDAAKLSHCFLGGTLSQLLGSSLKGRSGSHPTEKSILLGGQKMRHIHGAKWWRGSKWGNWAVMGLQIISMQWRSNGPDQWDLQADGDINWQSPLCMYLPFFLCGDNMEFIHCDSMCGYHLSPARQPGLLDMGVRVGGWGVGVNVLRGQGSHPVLKENFIECVILSRTSPGSWTEGLTQVASQKRIFLTTIEREIGFNISNYQIPRA